ncbi:virulence factor [Massilia sp. YMA4]|uniref:virulence factor n=1 Tax=Massilia sp. YMA4 TaxID=1593482 RepID=UPI001878F660
MQSLCRTKPLRLAASLLVLILIVAAAISLTIIGGSVESAPLTDGEIMSRFFITPTVLALCTYFLTGLVGPAKAQPSIQAEQATNGAPKAYTAQVVGLQWLNPLQRRDYPTEWQLLWTLGLARPNTNDDMVKSEPQLFGKLQAIGIIANGNNGRESFEGYHEKYVDELLYRFRDIYFKSSTYFYNAHSTKDRSTWRELAGIRVQYAIPEGRLNPIGAAKYMSDSIRKAFDIGNVNFPDSWTRSTPPDVHVTPGGPNAGFKSLAAGLEYLQTHPSETVWVMNWDAPSFPPKDEQINENMVLLVLAGPNYKTERAPLAWIGYPATRKTADFEAAKGKPSRQVQAWKATIEAAATNAGKKDTDIGYVIHDANNKHPDSPDRIANLAQTLTTELVEFDFAKQTFNTPALLGEMGAGTALTNVALGIAYANHIGKNVLVAGTTDAAQPTAVVVVPPEKVRPFNPDGPWFRARGGNAAFLPWWGLRHDAEPGLQGYSR